MVGTVTDGTTRPYSVGTTHDANNKVAMPMRISLKEFRCCPSGDGIVFMMIFIIVIEEPGRLYVLCCSMY